MKKTFSIDLLPSPSVAIFFLLQSVFLCEYNELQVLIGKLKEILSNEKVLLSVIKTEITEIAEKYGDYGVYCNGIFFALVSDNRFYIKPTEVARPLLRTEVPEPPYEGAKPYFYIEEIDDRDYLATLVKATCAALPLPKPRKKAAKKTL